jgi:signal transduction histidine kinase
MRYCTISVTEVKITCTELIQEAVTNILHFGSACVTS